MSRHAEIRCEQRGICQLEIDVLLNFGEVEHHKGRELYFMGKKGLRKAKSYLGKACESIQSELKDIYIVVDGELVVTAARRNTHHKRNRAS